jgi:hypothetical protein
MIFTGPWAGAGAAILGCGWAAAGTAEAGCADETSFDRSESGGTRVGMGGKLRVRALLSLVWPVVGGGATCGSWLATALVRSCFENRYQKNNVQVNETAVISQRMSWAFPPLL